MYAVGIAILKSGWAEVIKRKDNANSKGNDTKLAGLKNEKLWTEQKQIQEQRENQPKNEMNEKSHKNKKKK